MKKRTLFLVPLAIASFCTLIGAGFSSWYFYKNVSGETTIGVSVENKVSLSYTQADLGSKATYGNVDTLMLDSPQSGNSTPFFINAEKYKSSKASPAKNSDYKGQYIFSLTPNIENPYSETVDESIFGFDTATFTLTISLDETLNKYVRIKEDLSSKDKGNLILTKKSTDSEYMSQSYPDLISRTDRELQIKTNMNISTFLSDVLEVYLTFDTFTDDVNGTSGYEFHLLEFYTEDSTDHVAIADSTDKTKLNSNFTLEKYNTMKEELKNVDIGVSISLDVSFSKTGITYS